jgi:anti-sigma regulatory factor (Ser/Thr protein kinase)
VEGLDGLVATAAYQPEPTAAAAARRFVRDTLQTWLIGGATGAGDALIDDAVLLTSELVTNAVVHAGTPVEVTCKLTGGGVEVVVSDEHPARLVPEPPENEHIPAERTSGRGLLLPAALASAWGVTYGQSAKAVWFRIGQPEPGPEPGPGQGGEREDGLRAVPGAGFLPGPGPESGPALPAVLRPATVLVEAASAAAGNGTHRWPVPPLGGPGYDELLAGTVESARAAVGADAAYAMVPDEDGELRLRAAAGSFPSVEAGPVPVGAGPVDPAGPGGPGAPGPPDQAGSTQPGRRPGRGGRIGLGRRAGRVGLGRRAGPAGPLGPVGPAGTAGQQAGRARPPGQAWANVPSLAAVRAAAGAAPSLLTVPFVVDGRVTGLLAVASATAGRFHDDEAARLQQLADRWGPTLERARLAELERVRRGRIAALAQARGLLSGRAGADEVLALAGEAAVPRLVPWCAVLLPADGMGLRTVYARHMDEEQSAALAALLDRVGETMAGAGPPSRPASPARPGPAWRWPLTVPGPTQALADAGALAAETAWCFPLGMGDGAGVFAVGHLRDERLPREVAELAADLACRVGMALDNARLRVPG